jgi:hypothetical protein
VHAIVYILQTFAMPNAPDTTTLRVRHAMKDTLEMLARRRGTSLVQAQSDAVDALWREHFFETMQRQLIEMRSDPVAWADYLADAAATDVGDGL